jgi:quercetin dioxygenase-like cupin family protein
MSRHQRGRISWLAEAAAVGGRLVNAPIYFKFASMIVVEDEDGGAVADHRRGGLALADNWYAGNANDDAGQHRGWLLGHFLDAGYAGPRSTEALEVKWGIHPAGEARPEWTADDQRTAMLLLVSGRFRLDLTTGTTTLERQGDYVVWGPGIDHSWQAEQDSVVITVRWPSYQSK